MSNIGILNDNNLEQEIEEYVGENGVSKILELLAFLTNDIK